MTVETIEKDGVSYKLMYGFGRIQKARAFFVTLQPESVKRLLIVNPEATDDEVRNRVTPDEAATYRERINSEVVKLVFHDASDWDRSKTSREDYIDGCLPDSVGEEMRKRIQLVANESSLSEDAKKKSL